MPRYKDSPEVQAAKQERKDKLREFLSLLEVDDMHDLRSLFKEMVGEVLENGLEAELDDELGYSKYDYRNKNTKNSRNGYSRKTLKTSGGSVEIAVPRDRNGDFEPQLIKKNETTLSGDIEEKIISICRKVLIFLLVGIANVLDVQVIGTGSVLRTAVIFFYISNEGVSLLENAAHLGLPVPEKIKTVLEQLHDRAESEDK